MIKAVIKIEMVPYRTEAWAQTGIYTSRHTPASLAYMLKYLEWGEDPRHPYPQNIWGSVPGHGSLHTPTSLPGDKMEREGIRLTVRCVTRSCVNEKQVVAPHSKLCHCSPG